jgi:hypothetical protein
MDVALNMPKTKMNLGSMPAMTATLNTEASDVMHAVILPVITFYFEVQLVFKFENKLSTYILIIFFCLKIY